MLSITYLHKFSRHSLPVCTLQICLEQLEGAASDRDTLVVLADRQHATRDPYIENVSTSSDHCTSDAAP